MISTLFLELFKSLENGSGLDLPGVVLQHQQHIGSDCHIDRMIRSQQNDGIVLNGGDHAEVILLVVVTQRFQKLQNLYLVLEDSLSALFVGLHCLIKDSDQSFHTVYLYELTPRVPEYEECHTFLRCIGRWRRDASSALSHSSTKAAISHPSPSCVVIRSL